MKLHDPITGEELTLMSARGDSNECWRADEHSTVLCIMHEYRIDETEARRRLQNSDVENPVVYRDQVFWCE